MSYQEHPGIFGSNLKVAIILNVSSGNHNIQWPLLLCRIRPVLFTCEEGCQSVELYHSDCLDFNLTYFKILRKFKPLISVITMAFCAIATGQNRLEESSEVHAKDRITCVLVLFFPDVCILFKDTIKVLFQRPLAASIGIILGQADDGSSINIHSSTWPIMIQCAVPNTAAVFQTHQESRGYLF